MNWKEEFDKEFNIKQFTGSTEEFFAQCDNGFTRGKPHKIKAFISTLLNKLLDEVDVCKDCNFKDEQPVGCNEVDGGNPSVCWNNLQSKKQEIRKRWGTG